MAPGHGPQGPGTSNRHHRRRRRLRFAALAVLCAGTLTIGVPVANRLVPNSYGLSAPAGPLAAPPAGASVPAAPPLAPELVATFSIVARDPATGDLGVAVQSKFFAVGSVVPFAAAGIGAVATQSYANTTFGPRGLEMLAEGTAPTGVIDALLADDADRGLRQVGLVDAAGNATNFTGDGCLPWAGARLGEGYSVQGNLLAGPEVVDAMAAAYEDTSGDLATRLVASLAAGQAAGGDKRGRQSAALLVVREGGGYGGLDDRYIDLRVDDHDTPVAELQRLLDMKHAALAADEARRALLIASADDTGDRRALLLRAVEQARTATRLNEHNGWHWMTLAHALLASGDLEAAGAAGIAALEADPFIKTAVLQGIGGSTDVVEGLLEHPVFRRTWAEIGNQ